MLYFLPNKVLLADDKALILTAGLSKPPFVIEHDKKNSGIQLELMKAVFAIENKEVKFLYLPLSRSFASIDKWHSDGTITLPVDHKREGVYLSEPYIRYQNVLITLAEDNLVLNDFNDLSDKKIIAFQTAQNFLGPEYNKALQNAKDYREMADQSKQIEMLFVKRTEVLVIDITIFKYFLSQHRDEKYSKPYTVHSFFKPADYSAGFKDKATRDQFNRGLNKIKANGTYQKILNKYR
jgi:polar amino acid transport system substrate-binding protein